MNIAILTNFVNWDESYSLCRVVADQCKILTRNGLMPRLIVQDGFNHHQFYETKKIVTLRQSRQLVQFLDDIDLVFTHDLIFQSGMSDLFRQALKVARERPGIRWLHWVHSNGGKQRPQFPNAKIVAFHKEEKQRKKSLGYEAIIIPNPVDIMAGYDQIAAEIIRHNRLWEKDIIAVYPCRLDRGKQPHIVCEIFEHLPNSKVIIVDFHSTAGDKVKYRTELKEKFGKLVYFTSDLCPYQIPHQAVMNLFEYADILVQPSQSETDSLIIHEAMWQRCGLVLNFDLPRFREFKAIFGKFSSCIDVATGKVGSTKTEYVDRRSYMTELAEKISYQMKHNPILSQHVRVRKEHSLEALWNYYQEIIEKWGND